MATSTQTVSCPRCDAPATLVVHTEPIVGAVRLRFEFTCPNHHRIPEPQVQRLWHRLAQ